MRWVLGSAITLSVACAHAGELREVRLLDGPEATRVVFDLDAGADNNVFTLANPDRVVIDISGVRRGAHLNLNPAPRGIIKGVRSGPHDNGLRVVLDLSSPANPKSFGMQPSGGYGYRLILDLYPDKPAAPGAPTPALVTAAVAPAAAAATALADSSPAPAPAAVETAKAETPRLDPTIEVPVPASAPAVAAPAPVAVAAAPVAPVPVPAAAAPEPAPAAYAQPKDALHLAAKPIVVAVDAGHGGIDPGTHGRSGLEEKAVTLAIARKLAALIDAQPGMRAVLTRDGDYYVDLRRRTVIARKAQADLFVSIHCNSYKDSDMDGTAVYVLSEHGATTEQARWLANHENAADLVGGVDLHDKDDNLAAVLLDISQSATMDASFDLGNRLLHSLNQVDSLQKPMVQQAGFMVLKSPDIPSVLVETAFLTNPREEKMLGSPDYQGRFADAIFGGIKGYFSRYRPLQQEQVATEQSDHAVPRRRAHGKTVPVSYAETGRGGADN